MELPCNLKRDLATLKRIMVIRALIDTNGDVGAAARLLEIDVITMHGYIAEAADAWNAMLDVA